MYFSKYNTKYEKSIPGADIVFQPDGIHEYESDAWDIRISIGNTPLEEAYYFTVSDPDAVNLTIEQLLEKYALNPKLQHMLDVQEYPDLPFIQQELIQYRTNARQGLLNLEYYINCNPFSGPIQLYRRAKDLLCVCTYHDKSHDYRVLDIVIDPVVPRLGPYDIKRKQDIYGEIFLLLLFEYYLYSDNDGLEEFQNHSVINAFVSNSITSEYPMLFKALKLLVSQQLLSINSDIKDGFVSPMELTEKGLQAMHGIREEIQQLNKKYSNFDSVSVSPVALGIPDGFDLRIQMMEYEGLDCEKSVLLCVLDQDKETIFDIDTWPTNYEQWGFFDIIQDALAYKTNFTVEVLEQLQELKRLEQ